MDRVPEPELMDDTAQARAYAAADFAASDQAMVERLLGLFGGPAGPAGAEDPAAVLGPRIVDLGCGPGNITFRLAAACPQASVFGIDGAPAMLAIAAERLSAGAASCATTGFLQLVLPDPRLEEPPLAASFSAVVSNSLLHHLHDPAVFWSAAKALAAPGAALYMRDLRRPPSAAAAEALVEERMAGAPAVLRRDFHHSLLAAFTAAEVAAQLDRASLGRLQVAELEDRYLEVWGRL